MRSGFTLPIYIDLSATHLYAMTGALLAIRRHYDVIGHPWTRMVAVKFETDSSCA